MIGPKKKRFSRSPSVELRCSHMLLPLRVLSGGSGRRRLFVFTVALLFSFTLVVLVNQKNVINYGEFVSFFLHDRRSFE